MKKKLIILIIILSFLVIIFALGLNILFNYMKISSEDKIYYDRGMEILPNADYIVVPGAKIAKDYPILTLRHRLDYAFDLYEANKASKIIISGGYDKEVGKYETEVMLSYLISLGVNPEDIISDIEGNSTYQTLKRIKQHINDKSIILVTQEVYSYRAIYIAESLDIKINVFCSDPIIYNRRGRTMLREVLAQFKAILNCNLIPESTTLLEEVPFYFK